ncbi:6,7-dimethyl-8-ribityllumazine synthase [Parvularcula sp. IMCC14364]|uniref:6,7-dimethyl-8-ribityllumazine synthase n=1 Tax=Parvularcula sp. IMCC14364 TaxID=3067902 RepID=UPI0027407D83|nr:6,7-dimethyl-8-ribityllumazine synthase [Parvularcula sp. IMCC14364]
MRTEGLTTAIEGVHDGEGRRIAIIFTRWNDEIISEMRTACLDTLKTQGVTKENIEEIIIPGAFEFPLTCTLAAESEKFDAVIALGCVIRGETPHFDYVAGEAARGITSASLSGNTPVIFGVLTVNTEEQAWQRAARDKDNKGAEFALAALEMAAVTEKLKRV